MLFPFTPHTSPTSKKQDGSIDVEDLTKKIQDIVDRLNDKFNPPTEDECIELSITMTDYIKELGAAAKKSDPTTPSSTAVAKLPTPFKDNDKGRTLDERMQGMVLTKRKDRRYLDEKQKFKFHEKFIEGLPAGKGFRNIHIKDLQTVKDNDSAILAAVDILRINGRLEEKFMTTESHDLFTIRIFGPKGAPHDIIDAKNLFVDWMHVTADDVIKSCNCFSLNTSDTSWNDDLWWSTQTILNSIEDPKLLLKVSDHLQRYGRINRIGPLALYLTLREIAFCSETTVDTLSNSLSRNYLSNYPDESTDDHGTVWLKVTTFLKSFNKVPVNAKSLLLEQYSKCSVTAFRSHFYTLKSMNDPRLATLESIIQEGQDLERNLKNEKKWTPTKKQSSVFMTQDGLKSDVSKKTEDDKKGKSDKKKKPTHDKAGNPIDRHPPKANDSHERVNSLTKKTERWCGNEKCCRWGNHLTKDHDEWKKKFKASMKKRQDKTKGKDEGKTDEKKPEGAPLTVP